MIHLSQVRQCAWLLLAIAALALASCKKDDNKQGVGFTEGIFIANEGPFQSGSGSVSYWNRQTGEVSQGVFAAANGGEVPGNILQSMARSGNRLFSVVNNAGKVIATDATTLVKQGEITGLELPRYLVPLPGTQTAFVSQWGSDGVSGSVAVVNTSDYSIKSVIPVGSGPEAMLLLGNELWVANSGGFGRDSTVVIVDVDSLQVTGTIVVGDNPNAMVQDATGDVWVTCAGYAHNFDPNDPLSTKGRLLRITGKAVSRSFELPNDAGRLVINGQGNRLLYLETRFGGRVFDFYTDQLQLNTSPFLDGTWYSLGFDPVENTLLAGDARDFASAGVVRVVDANGTTVRELPAGIIPTHFLVLQ